MNSSGKTRVTNFKFAHYDPYKYILPNESNLSLGTLNEAFLELFNNDLYVYTLLVGKVKGLWWKYWFKDENIRGYSTGDIICVNGIQEMDFLKQYWRSIKDLMDYNTVLNLLPEFVITDDDIVDKYITGLNKYFDLGDKGLERQLYISLKDDNKDPVAMEDAWRPYLVTKEELHKRENLLVDILDEAMAKHEAEYHTALDELDKADSEYELLGTGRSIYEDLLTQYIPTKIIEGMETQDWADFISGDYGNKILGFGTVCYEYLHICKPLGGDVSRLETWVRTDGHVTVRGFVPTGLMTEIIPTVGTIEYNRWKMGGMRKFAFRFDYPINDRLSKLFFKDEEPVPEDLVIRGADKPVLEAVVYKRDDSKDQEYQGEFDRIEGELNSLEGALTGLQEDMVKYQEETAFEPPTFPQPNSDLWCKAKNMVYPQDSMSPALAESKFTTTKTCPFLFNPNTISLNGERKWLIDPKYKKSSSLPGLIQAKELITHIVNGKPDSAVEWEYWNLDYSTVTRSPQPGSDGSSTKDVYEWNVIMSLKIKTDTLQNLLGCTNGNVLNMTSSTDGRLGDFLSKDCVSPEFTITRFEKEQREESWTGSFKNADGKTVTGKITFTYEVITDIEAAAELKESDPESVDIERVSEDLGALADRMITDLAVARSTTIYSILTYTKGASATILYYPKNNEMATFDTIMESPAAETIKKNGHWDVFTDLLKTSDYEHLGNSVAAGDEILETHTFVKKSIIPTVPEVPSIPVDTVDGKDQSRTASNMRLIREFGVSRSPAIKYVTSAIVLPDCGQMITPTSQSLPGVTLSDWQWKDGQSATFTVPNGTQNVAFEITGIIDSDSTDLSLFDINEGLLTTADGQIVKLKWIWDLARYGKSLAKMRCEEDSGVTSATVNLGNSGTALKRLCDLVLNNVSFTTLMRVRTFDWTKFNEFMEPVAEYADSLGGYDELNSLFDLLYQHVETHIRFGYLYSIYESLFNNMLSGDMENKVLLNYIRDYLLNHDTLNASMVEQRLIRADELVTESLGMGKKVYATEVNNVVAELRRMHENHSMKWNLLKRNIPALPTKYDEDWNEYQETRASLLEQYASNIQEIKEYAQEAIETVGKIKSIKSLLDYYVSLDLEPDLDKYVRTCLAKLDYSATMYFRVNEGVCRGYLSYIDKWDRIFGDENSGTAGNAISNAYSTLHQAAVNWNKGVNK